MPVEVYVITPADYLGAVAAWFGVTLLATGFAVWVFWPEKTPPPVEVDAPEAVKTVELPRRSGPRTGTIHAPQYRRSDDDTVVIEQAGTRR